jgi:hypothetical protein
MENNDISEEYTVYYIKKTGKQKTSNSGLTEQRLKIANKKIPTVLKDKYKQYILSINNRIPFEEELDEWYFSHKP